MSKSNKSTYDFAVIGSGPAGINAAVQASKLGKKVVVIEKSPKRLGGSWIHTGTLPSKTLRESLASIASIQFHVGREWVDRIVGDLPVQLILNRAYEVAGKEEQLVRTHLESNNIDIVEGCAYLEDQNTIRINPNDSRSHIIKSDKMLISTGSRPRRPDNVPFDGWRVVCSDSILNIKAMPRKLIIFGAGVIGCEYACIFAALGVETVIYDGRTKVLQSMDQEITEELKSIMNDLGVTFKMGAKLVDVTTNGPDVEVEFTTGKDQADLFFFAAGRVSNTDHIGLENLNINVNDRGAIMVNEFFQTDIPCVYAAGDAIGPPALAATSFEQGRIASLHAFGDTKRVFPKVFPYGVYTIPELSTVGMSEEQAKKEKVNYEVGHAQLEEVARGQIRGDHHGLLKLIVNKDTHRIIGIHIVGADACNLVHIGMAFMHTDTPVQHIVDKMIFNYPTLAESYKVAAFNCLNKLFPDGKFKDAPVLKENAEAKKGKKKTAA